MSATKWISASALFVGFLGGAYVVVAQEDSVNWTHYIIAMAVMFAGLIASRIAAKDSASSEGANQASLETLRASLARIRDTVGTFVGIEDDQALTEVHERIDGELVEDLGEFVESRESMIRLFGMQTYADIMSAFATGERLINRTWSASADGYVDEVKKCLRQAQAEFENAANQLEAAKG